MDQAVRDRECQQCACMLCVMGLWWCVASNETSFGLFLRFMGMMNPMIGTTNDTNPPSAIGEADLFAMFYFGFLSENAVETKRRSSTQNVNNTLRHTPANQTRVTAPRTKLPPHAAMLMLPVRRAK